MPAFGRRSGAVSKQRRFVLINSPSAQCLHFLFGIGAGGLFMEDGSPIPFVFQAVYKIVIGGVKNFT